MQFVRGKNPKEALSLGGYSFDTLRVGAILRITKRFGLSREEGKIRNWKQCAVSCPRDFYMLITRIEECANLKRKNIHFILISVNGDSLKEDRERLVKKEAFPGWRTTGFIGNCSKRMFDYRLKVIKPGF